MTYLEMDIILSKEFLFLKYSPPPSMISGVGVVVVLFCFVFLLLFFFFFFYSHDIKTCKITISDSFSFLNYFLNFLLIYFHTEIPYFIK